MEEYLSRIANALERIANNLEAGSIDSLKTTQVPHTDGKTGDPIVSATPDRIFTFLRERGVAIKTLPAKQDDIKDLNDISRFMGEKFSLVSKVYELIKRDLNFQKGFSFNIKSLSQAEISMSTQLCTMLSRLAILERYDYKKSPVFNIYAKASCAPNVINYINGHWLESFVTLTVTDVVNELGLSREFAYIANPQIILPNGNDFELDCLFSIGDSIFWVESKTGNFQQYIHKYSELSRKTFQLKNSFLVLADLAVQSQDCDALSKLYDINVCFVENFKEVIRKAIVSELGLNDASVPVGESATMSDCNV